ncbi:Hypothetical protein BN69_1587 [Methylocystis sp. SC2]|nr:Hypothetical protein BN69_1587 [Methylocystis sp. SC2]
MGEANDVMPIMLGGYRAEENIRQIRDGGESFLVISVPMSLLSAHEAQALTNHGQSLAQPRSRGGLSACEAVAILEDRPWRRMSKVEANRSLRAAIAATDSESHHG